MVHPLKAATTFDCDGCGHHASFHKMDNKQDDEVMRRWEQKNMTAEERHDNAPTRPGLIRLRSPDVQEVVPKRRRIAYKGQAEQTVSKPKEAKTFESRLADLTSSG